MESGVATTTSNRERRFLLREKRKPGAVMDPFAGGGERVFENGLGRGGKISLGKRKKKIGGFVVG